MDVPVEVVSTSIAKAISCFIFKETFSPVCFPDDNEKCPRLKIIKFA